MENNSNLNINTINRLFVDFGELGLIISCKAKQFINQTFYSFKELERLLNILLDSVDLNIRRVELISIIYYLLSEYSQDYANSFHKRVDNVYELVQRRSKISDINDLYRIFNKIEFEEKFETLNDASLRALETEFLTFKQAVMQPNVDSVTVLLFEHYEAVLDMLLKRFEEAEQKCNFYLAPRISEITESSYEKPAIVEFIQLKTNYMLLRIYEHRNQGTINEALIAIQDLYERCLSKNEDYGIRIGFKFTDFLFNNFIFDKMYPILNDLLNILKKKMLFGHNEINNFLEILLNVISRLIFCSIILEKHEDSQRFLKKLNKYINVIKASKINDSLNTQNFKENLVNSFQFYFMIYSAIINKNENFAENKEIQRLIIDYKQKNFHLINNNDTILIDMFILLQNDNEVNSIFQRKIDRFIELIEKNSLRNKDLCVFMFCCNNRISLLTKSLSTDPSIEKQKQYIAVIRGLSKTFLNYLMKMLEKGDCQTPLDYPYFRDVVMNIYYALFLTFFYEKNYSEGLNVLEYFLTKEAGRYVAPSNRSLYLKIIKLKADMLFRKESFSDALNMYKGLMSAYEEANETGSNYALVVFNLGLCYLMVENKGSAKDVLVKAVQIYEKMNSVKRNIAYSDNINSINSLLESL